MGKHRCLGVEAQEHATQIDQGTARKRICDDKGTQATREDQVGQFRQGVTYHAKLEAVEVENCRGLPLSRILLLAAWVYNIEVKKKAIATAKLWPLRKERHCQPGSL